jgi:DNA-binding transcriptional LysR family regulator
VELRHLRYFTTLTEELHFGRAAARLHIAQPALSKQIANLERELGLTLFERNRRRVELTPSGRLLLPEAQRLVELSSRLQQSARRIRDGLVGTLRLGYTRTVADSALPELLRLHHRRYPSMLLSLRETTTQTAIDDVRDGIFDAAFLRHVSGDVDLELIEVKAEPAVVAVPTGHPLANTKMVRFAELKGEPLVMMTRDIEPQLYDHAIALCTEAGFTPTIVHEADSVQTTLSMVASGLGLAVVTSSAQKSAISGVQYLALTEPTPSIVLYLAHRKDHVSPSLAAFLQSVDAMKKKWVADELAGKS